MPSVFNTALNLYRASYANHPRGVWSLAILSFVNRMGTMVLPFLSVYLSTVRGFTLQETGLIASATRRLQKSQTQMHWQLALFLEG